MRNYKSDVIIFMFVLIHNYSYLGYCNEQLLNLNEGKLLILYFTLFVSSNEFLFSCLLMFIFLLYN